MNTYSDWQDKANAESAGCNLGSTHNQGGDKSNHTLEKHFDLKTTWISL